MKKHVGAALCCALLMIGENSFSAEMNPSPGINLLNRLVQEKIVGGDSFRLSIDPIPAQPAPVDGMHQDAVRPDVQQANTAAQINDLTQTLNDALAQKQALETELAALKSAVTSSSDSSAALRELERASQNDREKAAGLARQLAQATDQKMALEKQLDALQKQLADLQVQKPPAKSETANALQHLAITDASSKDVRVSYAVGAWYGDSAPQEAKKFTSIGRKLDLRAFSQGFHDRVNNRMQLPQDKLTAELASVEQLLATAMLSENQKQSKAIIDKAAKEKGAVKTPDGAVYKIMDKGKPPMATDNSNILFELDEETGTGQVLSSGEKGNSSVKDLPPLFQTIVKKLGVGGSAKMYIPGEQVYGESGIPGVVPPGTLSIMTLKVVGIK